MITLPGQVEVTEVMETSDGDQKKNCTNYEGQQNPLFPNTVEHRSLSSAKLRQTTNTQPNLGQLTLDEINVAFEEAAGCQPRTTLREQPPALTSPKAEYNHPTALPVTNPILVLKHLNDRVTPQLSLSIPQDNSSVGCNVEETHRACRATNFQRSPSLPQQLLQPQNLPIQPPPCHCRQLICRQNR